MITDLNDAIEIVSKNWTEYFNLDESLRETGEILDIVLRADDLFSNGERYFHHLIWKDDNKIREINLVEHEDVFTLVEEAQDSFIDNLDFPESDVPPYLMSEDEVFERYNLHIEIDDFDGDFTDEFGSDDAEDIRDRLEQVIDDRVISSCRLRFQEERESGYISLCPIEENNNQDEVVAACLIHIDNLFLAPIKFFTEDNLYRVFEEHNRALEITPRTYNSNDWYSRDPDRLMGHIAKHFNLIDLNQESRLLQSMAKIDRNKVSLSKVIVLAHVNENNENHIEDIPLEDYSESALIELLETNPFDFRKFTYEQKSIRRVALAAVRKHGHFLEDCIEEYRGEREFVLAAVEYNGSCISYALGGLADDREFIKQCLQISGFVLENLTNEDMLNDKELALLAINNHDSTFGIIKKLSQELKNDPDIILAGLEKDYNALSAASGELHNDRDFIIECVKLNGTSFGVLNSENFKNDREIVEQALDALCGKVAKYNTVANKVASNIGSELKFDKSIADRILKINPCVISYFPDLNFNKQEILGFIRINSATYNRQPDVYKNDLDVINCAIEKNPTIYSGLTVTHKENLDIAEKAIRLKPLLYVELSPNLKKHDKILEIILNNPITRN